jgi:hypothetical protein
MDRLDTLPPGSTFGPKSATSAQPFRGAERERARGTRRSRNYEKKVWGDDC